MSATLASSFAARHNALVPLTLGHSANAIELLLVPIAPDVHNATDLKARAFDFLSDLLCQHAEQYSSAELIAACNHIPGSSYNTAKKLLPFAPLSVLLNWKIQRFRSKGAFSPKGENGAASLREAKAQKRPRLQ